MILFLKVILCNPLNSIPFRCPRSQHNRYNHNGQSLFGAYDVVAEAVRRWKRRGLGWERESDKPAAAREQPGGHPGPHLAALRALPVGQDYTGHL